LIAEFEKTQADAMQQKEAHDEALEAKAAKEAELDYAEQYADKSGNIDETVKIRDKLEEVGQTCYLPLKEGRIEKKLERMKLIQQIKATCKEAGMENSLIVALEAILIKDTTVAFTPFECDTLEHFEDGFNTCLGQLTHAIQVAEEVDHIRAAHEASVADYTSCLEAYNRAFADEEVASSAVEKAKLAVESVARELARAVADRDAQAARIGITAS